MTVTTTANSVVYRGNGSATSYAVPFKVLDRDHLVVRRRDYDTGDYLETYTGTDFTYSGIGASSGTLTLAGTALANDYELVIERVVPYTQDLDLVNSGGFYPETVEEQLDLTTMGMQQIANAVGRAVVVPVGSSGIELPSAAERADKVLGFDDDGELEMVTLVTPTVTSATGQTVNTRTLLANITSPVNNQRADLTEPGAEGVFVFDSSNLSAQVTADPIQGNYVAPAAAASGASGAWKRRVLLSALLATVTIAAPIGVHALPNDFNDQLGASDVYHDGTSARFFSSRVDLIDFRKWMTETHYYIDWATGDDTTGDGSEATPWKTFTKVAAEIEAAAAGTAFHVHITSPKVGISGTSAAEAAAAFDAFDGKYVWVSGEGPEGLTRFVSNRENDNLAAYAWAAHGANGAVKSNSTAGRRLYRAMFDSKYLDHKGCPTPLVAAASAAEVETTPNTHYDDGTYMYVHMRDGREPDPDDGWIPLSAERSWGALTDSGTMVFENIEFAANSGTASLDSFKFRSKNAVSFATTTKIGFLNCKFYGSCRHGLSIFDSLVTCVENCVAAYNFMDGLNYHSNKILVAGDGRDMTVYEDRCFGYKNGFQGFWGQNATNLSTNDSTAHDSISIARVGCVYGDTGGGAVVDVGGCDSLNYFVRTGGQKKIANSAYPAGFAYECNTGEGLNPRMIVVGCEANDNDGDDYALYATGTSTSAVIYVAYWHGPATVRLFGDIKSWPDEVDIQQAA